MAFKLGDLVVDRIVLGVGEDHEANLLYTLTTLQEGTIDISADSVDATDGTGAVIKTFYRAKTGEFTATNSTISLPILEQTSGSKAQLAETEAFAMPRILTTSKPNNIELVGINDSGASAEIKVYAINKNGTLGAEYALSTGTATAGQYVVTAGSPSKLTITPNTDDVMWVIKHKRNATQNAMRIVNRSDAFAKSHKLTLKVLIVDPCETDTVLAAYVVFPNFQPSPEVSIGFSTDSTLDFSGILQTSYCGVEKVLYEIYVAQDDVEDAA